MKERILNIIGLSLLVICFVVSLGRILWPKPQTADGREIITIRLAHWQLEGGVREALDRLGREYEAMHPNVQIKQIPIPERIYTNWLITQLVGGTAPDVIQIGIGMSDERLARYFEPITTLVDSPNPYNKGTALEGLPMRETFFDGMQGGYNESLLEYYGVPLTGASIRMFYNLDLLAKITGSEKMPETFREFIELCREAEAFGKSRGEAIVPIAGSKYNGPQLMNTLFSSQTQRLMEELNPVGVLTSDPINTMEWYADGRWSMESPAILSGMRLMSEVAQFMQPGFMQLQRDDATFYFVQGRALMICSGSWDATSIRSQAPFRVGVSQIPFPTPEDAEFGAFTRGSISEAGSTAILTFGLTRASKNAEVAKDFLRFLGSYRANTIWTDVSRWVPSLLGVKPHADALPFLPIVSGGSPGFPIAAQPDATRVYDTKVNDLFGQTGSPEKFAAALAEGFLEAQASDLRRSLLSTGLNSKRRDTVLASLAVQNAKEPDDRNLADKFDEALQAVNYAERGYYMTRAALQATESAQNKKP